MSSTDSDMTHTQADVLAFLGDPASYPNAPSSVARIETHGAYVFLAGPDVYKIKRAVRYAYLDFSTLARRRAACEREVELNRPHAPQIYLGLIAITRDPDGRLAFNGTGVPVEWAVHMRRFDEADVLQNRAARGTLPDALGKALARAVHEFHVQAPIAADHCSAAQMTAILADVVPALKAALPAAAAAADDFALRAQAEVQRLTPLLKARAQAGAVRRCHGDLHLGNIVLQNGQPVLFDALEFDDRLATIDVFYDLAFLIMDLDHRRARACANDTLNTYLWLERNVGAYAGLAALPLFMGLRAAIRAMVRAQRAALATTVRADDPSSGFAARDEAHAYLARAQTLLTPQTPLLVLIGGLSGSGKSTLAHRLAPLIGKVPGAVHLRSDMERKALFGAGEFERLPAEAYHADVTNRVYESMTAKCSAALLAGHSVIADAVHARPAERTAIEALAAPAGARLVRLWLDAPLGVLKARVAARVRDASDATPEVVERQTEYDLGRLEWTRIDASGTAEDTFQRALPHVGAPAAI